MQELNIYNKNLSLAVFLLCSLVLGSQAENSSPLASSLAFLQNAGTSSMKRHHENHMQCSIMAYFVAGR